MSYSLAEDAVLSEMLGDAEVAAHFSADADIQAVLAFEAALARACEAAGLIPEAAGERIAAACARFTPDLARLSRATANDGVAIADLMRQLRDGLDEPDDLELAFIVPDLATLADELGC